MTREHFTVMKILNESENAFTINDIEVMWSNDVKIVVRVKSEKDQRFNMVNCDA